MMIYELRENTGATKHRDVRLPRWHRSATLSLHLSVEGAQAAAEAKLEEYKAMTASLTPEDLEGTEPVVETLVWEPAPRNVEVEVMEAIYTTIYLSAFTIRRVQVRP